MAGRDKGAYEVLFVHRELDGERISGPTSSAFDGSTIFHAIARSKALHDEQLQQARDEGLYVLPVEFLLVYADLADTHPDPGAPPSSVRLDYVKGFFRRMMLIALQEGNMRWYE